MLTATRYVFFDPALIPQREWLYGHHLIRRNISVTVAPGGVGKSSLTIVQALELASGRELLGHPVAGPKRIWLFNLEDERNELDRRIHAAMQHHRLSESDIGDRLFVDTGREQELILAKQTRDEIWLDENLIQRLEAQLSENKIDVLIVDPFVSTHQVNEMDNGKIDVLAKRWIKLAESTGCAIELVHHTRKLNGAEASSDSSRGASSLINAARSGRVLQRLSKEELQNASVSSDGSTYFYVNRDKSNFASAGNREIYRTVSVALGQGDHVGVVERFTIPDAFDGIGVHDLLRVQKAIDGKAYRYSEQASENWVGEEIARVLTLDPQKDRRRVKRLIAGWLHSGALVKESRKVANGKSSPVVVVGKWADEQ